ncbi:MAG: hypothetical protein L0Z68_05835 [Gammaproteobacteria bacterium]|nr:hypothetical protein [Gammaproteobacteria bacterium]
MTPKEVKALAYGGIIRRQVAFFNRIAIRAQTPQARLNWQKIPSFCQLKSTLIVMY